MGSYLRKDDARSDRPPKRVSFATDTKTEDNGRNLRAYYRSKHNQAYKPGKFAASNNHLLQDTSFMRDPYFDCTQLKVFTGTPDEFEALLQSHQVPHRCDGITTSHPRRDEIITMLYDLYEHDEETFLDHLRGADWILLSIEHDKLLEVCLIPGTSKRKRSLMNVWDFSALLTKKKRRS
jgi:hypothetical protein